MCNRRCNFFQRQSYLVFSIPDIKWENIYYIVSLEKQKQKKIQIFFFEKKNNFLCRNYCWITYKKMRHKWNCFLSRRKRILELIFYPWINSILITDVIPMIIQLTDDPCNRYVSTVKLFLKSSANRTITEAPPYLMVSVINYPMILLFESDYQSMTKFSIACLVYLMV